MEPPLPEVIAWRFVLAGAASVASVEGGLSSVVREGMAITPLGGGSAISIQLVTDETGAQPQHPLTNPLTGPSFPE